MAKQMRIDRSFVVELKTVLREIFFWQYVVPTLFQLALSERLYVVSITAWFALLFSVLDEARGMGKTSRVTMTRAVLYQRLPLLIPFLSKTEVAHCTIGDCHCGVGWALKGHHSAHLGSTLMN